MANDKFRLYRKFILILIKYSAITLYQRIQAAAHRWTYRQVPSPKNFVILGGSFAGVSLAKRLTETLPTGYRVVLVEKNSHFNYVFNFPRYSVLQGHEQKAFIPYAGLAKDAPKGIFELVKDFATNVRDGEVELKSGARIKFEYLAIATGTSQNLPAQVKATEKEDGSGELRNMQAKIKAAKSIAIVGGGPVGVQLVGDIKTFHKDKRVLLIHSRNQLLPNFGKRLHDYVMEKLTKLGVKVMLEERPQLPSTPGATSLQFTDGASEYFEFVIPCTGQTPNSSVLSRYGSDTISAKNGRIFVKPALQVLLKEHQNSKKSHIFAIGDVAKTGGPKMGRAGMVQAEIVRVNIVSLIKGKHRMQSYEPPPLEGALKLSLGKADCVMYLNGEEGDDLLVPMKSNNEDLEVDKAWNLFNADPKMSST